MEVRLSYIEIYNEQIRDMLSKKSNSKGLNIVEDPEKGHYVKNVTEIEIKGSKKARELIELGNSRRTMAATLANQYSSRSHAIA